MSIDIFANSNNFSSPRVATLGNIIIFDVKTDVVINSISGTINGSTLIFFIQDNFYYKAYYTVTNLSVEGNINISFTINNIAHTNLVQEVFIDLSTPQGVLTITTSSGNIIYPSVGEEVTLTLEVDRPLSTYPKINWNGIQVTQYENIKKYSLPIVKWEMINTTTWVGKYIVREQDSILREFQIDFVDTNGKIGFIKKTLNTVGEADNLETQRILGRISPGTGKAEPLTKTQLRDNFLSEDGYKVLPATGNSSEDFLLKAGALPGEVAWVKYHHKHIQVIPNSLWVINHNLNKKPTVNIIDNLNTKISGEINYLNLNSLEIRFFSNNNLINVAGEAHLI